eukprot:5301833-Pyramimonas_sp.AAC.1
MTCALAKDDQMWEKSVVVTVKKARSLGFTLPTKREVRKRWEFREQRTNGRCRERWTGSGRYSIVTVVGKEMVTTVST